MSVAKKVAIRFAAEQDQWEAKLAKLLEEVRVNPTWLVRSGVGGTAIFRVNTSSLGNAGDLAKVYGHKGGPDFAMAWVEAPVFGQYLSDAGVPLREGSIHFADLVQAHAGGPRPLRLEGIVPMPLDNAIGMVIRVSGSWSAPVDTEAVSKFADELIVKALAMPETQAALGRWKGRTLSTKTAQVIVTVPTCPADLPVRDIKDGFASFATHER